MPLVSYHDVYANREKMVLEQQESKKPSLGGFPIDDNLEEWKNSFRRELAQLRNWLSKQAHLPRNLPDEYLLILLHASYYDISDTKKRLDEHFTIRSQAPEIFKNRNIGSQEMKQTQKITRISAMRHGTPKGHNVIYIDCLDSDAAQFDFTQAMKLAGVAIDTLVKCFPREDENILVFDMKNTAIGHVFKTSLPVLKKVLAFAQKALPFRLTQIHVINAFPLVKQIQWLINPFMDEKLRSMIHIHMKNNMSTLYPFIPKSYLPKEYGGESTSLEKLNNELLKIMQYHESYLKSLEFFVVDERQRN